MNPQSQGQVEAEPDLHGHEKQPFPNFTEDGTYVEAVTLGKSQALSLLRDQGFDTTNLERVWMRWVNGDEARERSNGMGDEAWLECEQSHPAAVPFWKDAP